jgi:hypothetical protein
MVVTSPEIEVITVDPGRVIVGMSPGIVDGGTGATFLASFFELPPAIVEFLVESEECDACECFRVPSESMQMREQGQQSVRSPMRTR